MWLNYNLKSFQSTLPLLHKPVISLTDRLFHQQHARNRPDPLGVEACPVTSARCAARSHMTDLRSAACRQRADRRINGASAKAFSSKYYRGFHTSSIHVTSASHSSGFSFSDSLQNNHPSIVITTWLKTKDYIKWSHTVVAHSLSAKLFNLITFFVMYLHFLLWFPVNFPVNWTFGHSDVHQCHKFNVFMIKITHYKLK